MSTSNPVLVAGVGDLSKSIAASLVREGYRVLPVQADMPGTVRAIVEKEPAIGGLVVVGPAPDREQKFLDITDADLEHSLAEFLDLFEALSILVPHLVDDAPVVHVGHRGHLGAWGGTHDNAFSGAVAGLMRSLTLEGASRRLRVNAVAIDFPDDASRIPPAETAQQITDLTTFLVSPASAALSGELLLANRGGSLRFREARERSATPKLGASS